MPRPGGKSVPYPRKARERIKTGSILKRLEEHTFAEIEIVDGEAVLKSGKPMTATQIRSAEILLKKTIPDLKQTEHVGEGGGPVIVADITRLADAEEVLRRYGIDPDDID